MARRDDERDLDAAERALGTLSLDGEGAGEARLRERWEMRFAALGEVIPPVTPPAGLYRGICEKIARDSAMADLAAERRRRRGWQSGAVFMGAVAAALTLFIALPREMLPEDLRRMVSPATTRGQMLVATVTHDDNPLLAGMVIHVDTEAGTATIVPTLVTAPDGRAYEVWHSAAGEDAKPISLGLLPAEPVILRAISAGPGDVFAISEEPPGGSPDGSPTTPLFHGTVVAAR
ncbi:MAG: anti-sigma factor [Pseudomonadota bacterium]